MIVSGGIFEKNEVEIKLKKIEGIILKENFWKDKDHAKKTIKQKKIFENILNSYKILAKNYNLEDLFNLAMQEKMIKLSMIVIKLLNIQKNIKTNEIIVFYLVKMTILIFILRYMPVPVVQKSRLG